MRGSVACVVCAHYTYYIDFFFHFSFFFSPHKNVGDLSIARARGDGTTRARFVRTADVGGPPTVVDELL